MVRTTPSAVSSDPGACESKYLCCPCRLSARWCSSAAVPVREGDCSGGGEGDGRQVGEGIGERAGRGPMDGSAQCRRSGSIDQSCWDREEAGAQGLGHHQLVLFDEPSELGTPTDHVVGQHGAAQPRRVGREVTRWASSMPAASFQSSMHISTTACAVKCVELGRRAEEVGHAANWAGASLVHRSGRCGAR